MRTTVTLDDDLAVAVEQLRRERGLATSAAVNALARRGMAEHPGGANAFTQASTSLGAALVPLDDIGTALELLEGEAHGG